jgi:tRNA pseudouridine38-40 synthase
VSARALRLTLAYDGTDFAGWQRQPVAPTVQAAVAQACERILGAPTRVTGASRTDAGVHALRQVASLVTASSIPAPALGRALNAVLPAAIRVLEANEVPSGFDARRSARGKRYAYLIDTGSPADPFLRRYAWHVTLPLDASRMAAALPHLRGTRDFSAFCASAGRGRSPVCTVRSVRLLQRRRRLAFLISGDSFLHHMVRNVVGSLIEVGRGARAPDWIAEVLAGRDRARAGPTAPAQGLFLVRVMYAGRGASAGRLVDRLARPPVQ